MARSFWRYTHACVIGTSHLSGAVPCQDAAHVALANPDRSPVLILVASDGAGSAPYSHDGSKLACSAFYSGVIEYLQPQHTIGTITRDQAEQLVGKVIQRLQAEADARDAKLKEFACTLLAALVDRDVAIFLQIGDGAIVVNEGEGYRPVFWPQTGEYANTTFFLTDSNAVDRLRTAFWGSPFDDIAAFTDGLQSLALHYASRTAHVPFFRSFFERLRHESPGESETLRLELEQWLDSKGVNERTDDDKTLVLATRGPLNAKGHNA